MTEQEYRDARRELRRLNRMIDDAPMTAKPVFRGICELHAAVADYERYKARHQHRRRKLIHARSVSSAAPDR
jgi:hypothetical protein